jgi:hypothetical protein
MHVKPSDTLIDYVPGTFWEFAFYNYFMSTDPVLKLKLYLFGALLLLVLLNCK